MKLIKCCCDCGKITSEIELTAEQYNQASYGFPDNMNGKDLISHGFCSGCAEKRISEIKEKTNAKE